MEVNISEIGLGHEIRSHGDGTTSGLHYQLEVEGDNVGEIKRSPGWSSH